MGIKYLKDDDLDFLQYCSEDELKLLARYMTHDKDGEQRFTSELLSDNDFKIHMGKPNQNKLCWQLIVGELQHYGGDSFANLIRGSGVVYKEILSDVCEKYKVKFDKKEVAYEIENKLLDKLLCDSWEKMNAEQREEFLKDVGLNEKLKGVAGLLALQMALNLGGFASLNISRLVAISIAMRYVGVVASFGVARGLAVFAGPIGIALTTLLTIPAISGSAYRVTIPCVCQIAYMRRKYSAQDRF